MTFVVDFASSYQNISGADLLRIGVGGWICYAGCDDTAKNVSKPKFQEYIDTGLPGALVIENGTQDVLGGDKAGAYLGQMILDGDPKRGILGAVQLGYDAENCILFTSADFNETTQSQYTQTVDCMGAFSSIVPVAGYYGDGDSIDQVVARVLAVRYGWQSDSTSFSPQGTSALARLQQKYNDPRAQGLEVDVDDVLRTPLAFMTLTPTPEDDDMGAPGAIYKAVDNTMWVVYYGHRTMHQIDATEDPIDRRAYTAAGFVDCTADTITEAALGWMQTEFAQAPPAAVQLTDAQLAQIAAQVPAGATPDQVGAAITGQIPAIAKAVLDAESARLQS